MRHRSFIFVAVFVFLLIVGAVAAYAYDNSRDDQIAKGVSVAGHDVGGMSASQARAVVRRELAVALARPVVVTRHSRRFKLSAADAKVRADVGGMVDEALAASREGNAVSRTWRDVTGGEVNKSVPARVTYDRAAVRQLVSRVRKSLDQPARDAHVDFPSLSQVKEQSGRAVQAEALQRGLERALADPSAGRTVKAPVTVVKPKVTRAKLADQYPTVLVVDRNTFHLNLYKALHLEKSYTVAIGAQGFDTPAGLYHIQNKAVNPTWSVPKKPWAGSLGGTTVPGGSPDNPLKARWLGIFNGAGIHGTDEVASLGHAASHGCVRMGISDVIDLYPRVPVGAPIYIG
jgi:lipoprotein-anchoring transpeptidase ErfK/SrfK